MSQESVLVTGATGNFGRDVTKVALEAGFRVKAATRHPADFQKQGGEAAVALDFNDGKGFSEALYGVRQVFLVPPPFDLRSDEKLRPFIDEAAEQGVNHIVFCSAFGADANEEAPIRKIEHYLAEKIPNWTILRPNFFMENFNSHFAGSIVHQGVIALAAADGKTSFVSTADLAEAVVATFRDPDLRNQSYNLTGAEALDHYEVANELSAASGKAISYQPISEEEMLEGARQAGMPEEGLQYMAMLFQGIRAGYTSPVTDDLQKLIGRQPTPFSTYAKRYAAVWA